MTYYVVIVETLGAFALLATGAALVVLAALALPGARDGVRHLFHGRDRHPLGWAWIVATVAMAGSLYLSDVVGLLPCRLCWFQRIAMYPMVLVLGVGWLRGDAGVWRYALPLSVVGLLISIYHVVLQFQPHLELVPCDAASPCSVRYLSIYGFVSIPVMAGAAFLLITSLLLVLRLEPRGPTP